MFPFHFCLFTTELMMEEVINKLKCKLTVHTNEYKFTSRRNVTCSKMKSAFISSVMHSWTVMSQMGYGYSPRQKSRRFFVDVVEKLTHSYKSRLIPCVPVHPVLSQEKQCHSQKQLSQVSTTCDSLVCSLCVCVCSLCVCVCVCVCDNGCS